MYEKSITLQPYPDLTNLLNLKELRENLHSYTFIKIPPLSVNNGNVKPSTDVNVASPPKQPQDTKLSVVTNITMEDQKQVEQLIRNYLNYLNYLDTKNYGEAWKLLSPQDLEGVTQESFMNPALQSVKTIKLISIKGYNLVAGINGNTVVYDTKVPTVYFHLELDVEPTEGTSWGKGRNGRFIMGRRGIDGKWLLSIFATSPYFNLNSR
jgi:hypothetical protein